MEKQVLVCNNERYCPVSAATLEYLWAEKRSGVKCSGASVQTLSYCGPPSATHPEAP